MTASGEHACQVVVIGAGPTGLTAAYLLHQAGVRVRVIDKNAGPSKESRAAVMSPRSLEVLASLGLDGELFKHGVVTTEIELFVSGSRIGTVNYDAAHAPDTPYQFILMIPQSATEQVLLDALATVGLQVERGIEVTGFEQETSGVRIDAQRAGQPMTFAADYVIGADGAHSVVRSALKLTFEGAKYAQNFLLGDVEVQWAMDHERFRVFMHGDRIGVFLPLYGGRSRIMTTDMAPMAPGDGLIGTQPLELVELERTFAEVVCHPVRLTNPDWLTHFRTHHRMVDRYRVGRVFVAGDAAHIHSPAGGQGMNTGIQDATNLAWKLASVLRNGAPDSLLTTYETERLPVAQDVLRFTDRVFNIAAGQTGWQAKLRDVLAPVIVGSATKLDFVQDKAFRKFAQVDIAYAPSVAVDDGGAEHSGPRTGERAPNARISRRRDMFDLLAGYRFNIMALSRRRLTARALDEVIAALAGLARTDRATHIVARLTIGRHEAVELVESAEVFERYGLTDADAQALLVVRPDGHIAWRRESLDFTGCKDFLASLG